jgi:hypothetical protein
MALRSYRERIRDGIEGLPEEALVEVARLVDILQDSEDELLQFVDDLRDAMLLAETRRVSRASQRHLEEEFEGYDQKYPKE